MDEDEKLAMQLYKIYWESYGLMHHDWDLAGKAQQTGWIMVAQYVKTQYPPIHVFNNMLPPDAKWIYNDNTECETCKKITEPDALKDPIVRMTRKEWDECTTEIDPEKFFKYWPDHK